MVGLRGGLCGEWGAGWCNCLEEEVDYTDYFGGLFSKGDSVCSSSP